MGRVGYFRVFYDIKEPSYAVRSLKSADFQVTGASAYPAAATIWDSNAQTRWTTEASQRPGQFIEIDLGRVWPEVCQVFIFSGTLQDMPADLEIKGSLDRVNWTSLVRNSNPFPFFWSGGKPVSLYPPHGRSSASRRIRRAICVWSKGERGRCIGGRSWRFWWAKRRRSRWLPIRQRRPRFSPRPRANGPSGPNRPCAPGCPRPKKPRSIPVNGPHGSGNTSIPSNFYHLRTCCTLRCGINYCPPPGGCSGVADFPGEKKARAATRC